MKPPERQRPTVIWVLVNQREAQQLAKGTVSRRLQRLLTRTLQEKLGRLR